MAGRLRMPSRPRGPRDEARMTLIEHLGELRSRIIKIAVVFFAAAIVAWFFRVQIFDFLLVPAGDALNGKLYVTGVTEQFINDAKLALYVGFVFTIPVLLYQAWAFVVPAVGDVGRAFTYTLITLASSLFLAGVAFGYYFILPVGLPFLLEWAPDRYQTITTSNYYMSFVTRFLLASGAVFELPAATYVGAKLELVDAPLLKRYRKHAIIANALIAAAVTPGQDPFSMILLGIPMLAMYELSILIARYINPTVAVHELARRDDEDTGESSEAREDLMRDSEDERLYEEGEDIDRRNR